MRLPDSWTERLPFLEALEELWDPVPQVALVAWLIFYCLFLYQAARGQGILLLMDGVFVPIHEGGHLLFRFFGEFVSVAGGTILQLLVPILLTTYFLFHRQAQGVAFCLFFMFEQFLPISTYMADARAQELPLLTIGDTEYVIHDWNYLFGKLGVLDHDIQIAGLMRFLGWAGMIAVVIWLLWRGVNDVAPAKSEIER
ncbi:MAG TPA: hypothetical protein VEX69_05290 [Candidatus Limnocylindria bacterium]|nr:hypothetical protein [Candidatus Limnocylindria bacterium]